MEYADRFQSGMILICDAQGRLLSANPPALAALKLTQTQAAGLMVDTLFESSPPGSILQAVTAKAPTRCFCDLLSVGSRKPVELYVEPLHDVGGGVKGAILAARDLPSYAAEILRPVKGNKNDDRTCESSLSDINEDLEIARAVQAAMLPDIHNLSGLSVATAYRPCLAVGGDFYDAFPISRERMAVLMFDVSGHGVSAGLYAAMAHALFSRHVSREDSPGEVFYRVNRELARLSKTGKYLTAFLGFFDVHNRMFTYSGAGHPAPLHLTAAGRCTELKGGPSFLGMYGDEDPACTVFGDLCLLLSAGDRLCMYTDGLVEATSHTGEMFGPDKLRRILETMARRSASEIRDTIMNAVDAHMGKTQQSDDITLMVLEVA